MDRLHGLNPAQREAVTTLSGPLLVLAGAGTGKTRVITHRMAELIRRGTPPDRILSVTFTNKAAREMQERSAALLGRRLKARPVVCTFHAYCVGVLRQEIEVLGYPRQFVICDRGDQESAARTALREIRVGAKTLRPGDLLSRIGRWKTAGVPPERASDGVDCDLDYLCAAAYRRYQAHLQARGAVDFDDLLLLTRRLFETYPDVLARHQGRFDHVQIDEYQDTNGTQFSLVEALVRPHRNLCAVGDDDQSIYGWRGAEVGHILDFQQHFPGAKIVRLEHNYRSTDTILELANRLVEHNCGRHRKRLIAGKRGNGNVRFLVFEDDAAEAEAIVREINFLCRQQRVPLGDVTILFRTNEQPRLFEAELRRVQLPYVLVGGESYFDRREVRDLLAYLKVLADPRDEASLLRIINTPARGIGDATVQRLLARAVRRGSSLWDALPDAAAAGELPARAVAALAEFRELLHRFRREMTQTTRPLHEVLRELIATIDYAAEIQRQYKTPNMQSARWASVEQFVDAVRLYVERTAAPSLAGFLEETALSGRDEEADRGEKTADNTVRLMTLHSAKGLEFRRVYLVGLEEGLLPHHRALEAGKAAIEEERRLAYVGITRAMDYLTVSRAASRMNWGKRRPSLPSRFVFEMSPAATHASSD